MVEPTGSDTSLAALGAQEYVSLTTFRPDGRAVATPVRVAPDGDALVVQTPQDTEVARVVELVHRKYGLKFGWSMLLERLTTGRRRPRFGLRITPGTDGGLTSSSSGP